MSQVGPARAKDVPAKSAKPTVKAAEGSKSQSTADGGKLTANKPSGLSAKSAMVAIKPNTRSMSAKFKSKQSSVPASAASGQETDQSREPSHALKVRAYSAVLEGLIERHEAVRRALTDLDVGLRTAQKPPAPPGEGVDGPTSSEKVPPAAGKAGSKRFAMPLTSAKKSAMEKKKRVEAKRAAFANFANVLGRKKTEGVSAGSVSMQVPKPPPVAEGIDNVAPADNMVSAEIEGSTTPKSEVGAAADSRGAANPSSDTRPFEGEKPNIFSHPDLRGEIFPVNYRHGVLSQSVVANPDVLYKARLITRDEKNRLMSGIRTLTRQDFEDIQTDNEEDQLVLGFLGARSEERPPKQLVRATKDYLCCGRKSA